MPLPKSSVCVARQTNKAYQKESLSKQSSSTAFYMQLLTISPSLKGLSFLAKMWEIL